MCYEGMGEEEITSVERLVAEARRKAAPGGIYGTQMREKALGLVARWEGVKARFNGNERKFETVGSPEALQSAFVEELKRFDDDAMVERYDTSVLVPGGKAAIGANIDAMVAATMEAEMAGGGQPTRQSKGIEAKPSRARTDSITLPSLPSAGEQTKRGAQTARALGSASRSSRRGSQQGQGQPSFFMNNAGGQPRRGSVPNRPTGADKADLNQLIKEAKARQALLRAQSQTKLEGDSGGKTDPEEVRSRLRTGRTRQELEAAMNEAKELGMTYEATLAEKKLEGMKE
ncbi:hypothetical protein Pmar_PMAR011967 [Perkinsus marinus ATCC 50983]|uniref:Uncharacterized protein n=1 Tax=Perkinsus marinus (strain ATCC 50983 / TXsc) TaxID=423536 RepID=C5LBT8_PERM5|nr:hypothetical protein Pmar_PMAR011967 [Perkinsus marinus ATCC 50983]EER05909.1 hypothetical protein Pmar_PMAR011967 [Perkinsus marinus ATCC 50983]|eukprot:XP_002774093.1 hypothetical protein Pmar_PMAR011967 [Perkinsus marinus ATCC 50983]